MQKPFQTRDVLRHRFGGNLRSSLERSRKHLSETRHDTQYFSWVPLTRVQPEVFYKKIIKDDSQP